MNFIDLLKMYEKDTTINRENISSKLFECPVLHGIYSKWLYQWRRKFINVDNERAKKYKELYYYFKKDYELALDKKEICWHIETHDDYIDLNSKCRVLESEINQIESFVKHCSNLSFFCQNIISYEQFINGQ